MTHAFASGGKIFRINGLQDWWAHATGSGDLA